MVFDRNTNPAYIHTPDRVRKWLQYQISHKYSVAGYTVRIGTTMKFVTVTEYLGGETENQEGQNK